MSCICQYVTNASTQSGGTRIRLSFEVNRSSEIEADAPAASQNENYVESSKEAVTDDTKIAVCVSELAKFRSENWLLKKKLQENEVTIKNLEDLMSTIVNKQNQVMNEMIQLRKRNYELETECNLQREYHAIERNALIKEVQVLKTMSKDVIYTMSGDEEEDLTQTGNSQEYENQLTTESESDSDEDNRYDPNNDDYDLPTISSTPSTGPSSPYSSDSESDEDA